MLMDWIAFQRYKLLNVSAAFPPNKNGAQRRIGGSGEHMVTAALGGVIQPMMGSTVGENQIVWCSYSQMCGAVMEHMYGPVIE